MKTKRILAALLAAATLTVSIGSMAVNAEGNEAVSADMAALSDAAASVGIAEEVDALIDEGQLSAADTSMLAQVLADNDSEPFYYEHYDKLSTAIAFMPGTTDNTLAQHGVAFLNKKAAQSCYVRFYVNKNVVDTNLTSINSYVVPESNARITSAQNLTSEDSTNSRCYRVYLGVTGSIPAGSTAFYYLLPSTLGGVTSEQELYKYLASKPAFEYNVYSDDGKQEFAKCLFAKGDVNRDGFVDRDDSLLILKEVVKLGEPNPNRGTTYGNLDRQAFRLAADFNGDGDVDIMDNIALNRALMANNN